MGLNPEAWARKQLKQSEDWYRRRSADIEARKQDLENLGREFWNAGTRAGQFVAGETQQKLQQVGSVARRSVAKVHAGVAAVRDEGGHAAAEISGHLARMRPPTLREVEDLGGTVLRGALDDGAVILRGASDGATFGLGDKASAFIRAAPWQDDWTARYAGNIAQEKAQDAYDAEHHRALRTAGEIGGAVGSLVVDPAATGLAAGKLILAGARAGPMLAKLGYEAAELTPRLLVGLKGVGRSEIAAQRIAPLVNGVGDGMRWTAYAGGAGAGNGVLGQAVADRLSNRESSLSDYAASALGGLADGVATRYGGARAGGFAGGAVSEAAGQALNGAPIDVSDVILAGRSGALIGDVASAGTTKFVKSFSPRLKGVVGEKLSLGKSRLQGDNVEWFVTKKGKETVRTRVPVQGGYTVPDQVLLPKRSGEPRRFVEAKLGEHAKLSDRQAAARDKFGDNYRIDHWRESDVGAMAGGTVGSLSPAFIQDYLDRPRRALWPQGAFPQGPR